MKEKIEKALKHLLKRKVTINGSVLVLFLIGGSSIFSKNIEIAEETSSINIKREEELQSIRTKDEEMKKDISVIMNGYINLESDGNKNAHGIRITSEKAQIENNGIIKIVDNTNFKNGKAIGIEVIGNRQNLGSSVISKVVNNGEIIVTNKLEVDHTIGNLLGITLNVFNGEVINNGHIIVRGNHGIGINANLSSGNIVNNGVICLKDARQSIGIRAHLISKMDVENKGIIRLKHGGIYDIAIENNGSGRAINTGTVKVENKTADELRDIDMDIFFNGKVENKGIFVDKNGNYIEQKDDIVLGGPLLDSDKVSSVDEKDKSIVIGGQLTQIAGGKKTITLEALNIVTTADILTTKNGSVKFDGTTLNFSKQGIFNVKENSDLYLSNGVLNKTGRDTVAIKLEGSNSKLYADNMVFNGDIAGNGSINFTGDNRINGNIGVGTNIGDNSGNKKLNKVTANSSSSFAKEINIGTNGQLILELGKDLENSLANSSTLTVKGNNSDDIVVDISNITGKTNVISLGKDNIFTNIDVTTNFGDNGVYKITDRNLSTDGKSESDITVSYNENLFEDDPILNDINNSAPDVNDYFDSNNLDRRKEQMDLIYSANIYSQTLRNTYDNYKFNESILLAKESFAKVGEWQAHGEYIFNKKSYDRTGRIREYNTDVKTNGLMGNLEYGLDNNSNIGVIFSGTKQDIKTEGGNSKGDLFYLAGYKRIKLENKIELLYGGAYQLGKYDSDNHIGNFPAGNSYNTNAYGVFGQIGKDTEISNGISLITNFGVGYTYVEQEKVKDSYFQLAENSISTIDTNFTLGIKKEVVLENSKLLLSAETKYTKVFGETGKKIKANFDSKDNNPKYFRVLGAELSEENIGISLSGVVERENGIFYNAGVSYIVGDKNLNSTNVQLGIGYKF